jgi:hypothetical protein
MFDWLFAPTAWPPAKEKTADSNVQFELSANIWPVVDMQSGLIQRIAARAYALPAGNDELLSRMVRGLAATDFTLAQQYPVSKNFILHTEHGSLPGAVSVQGFNRSAEMILGPILRQLEDSCPAVVGISMVSGTPQGTRPELRFSETPYLVTTFLMEDLEGNLTPQLRMP